MGSVLMCVILLSSLFLLFPPICGPVAASRPPRRGSIKADGGGCSLSLRGLDSLLSSVRRLCGQAREGTPTGRARHLLSCSHPPCRVARHLPQGRKISSPRKSPSGQLCSSVISPCLRPGIPLLQKNPSWSYAKPSSDLREEGTPPTLPWCRVAGSNMTQHFNNITFSFYFLMPCCLCN